MNAMNKMGAEAERLRRMIEAATPPEECGPEIPVAPVRGPMLRFTPREMVPTSTGGFVSRRSGWKGRDAARVVDVFDLMIAQARKAHQRQTGGVAGFVAPFNAGQVSAARDYAALSERCAASGVKCSSLEALAQRGAGGGDREEAMLRDFRRLRDLHARIGAGLAREVRHVRPSDRGDGVTKGQAIRVRRVVDMVCLGGKSLSAVLVAHGWSANTRGREGLRKALCGALDRMQGYDLNKTY
jgi:hypothetical protein